MKRLTKILIINTLIFLLLLTDKIQNTFIKCINILLNVNIGLTGKGFIFKTSLFLLIINILFLFLIYLSKRNTKVGLYIEKNILDIKNTLTKFREILFENNFFIKYFIIFFVIYFISYFKIFLASVLYRDDFLRLFDEGGGQRVSEEQALVTMQTDL